MEKKIQLTGLDICKNTCGHYEKVCKDIDPKWCSHIYSHVCKAFGKNPRKGFKLYDRERDTWFNIQRIVVAGRFKGQETYNLYPDIADVCPEGGACLLVTEKKVTKKTEPSLKSMRARLPINGFSSK